MPTNRRADKAKRMEQAQITARAARLHWVQQLLDWPLEAGSLASRLTEAEVAALRRGAEEGKLFYGTSD